MLPDPPARAARPLAPSRGIGLLTCLAILAPLALLIAGCFAEAASCEMCGRDKCRNMTMTIAREDGTEQHVCCARCGAHALAKGAPARSIRVKDFDSAHTIDATRAIYVEGSDVHPCRGIMTEPPRDDQGCCRLPAFDRCEPSVVAFATREAAQRFMRVHGGTLTTWGDITRPAPPPAPPAP